jgi:hypothetical protein
VTFNEEDGLHEYVLAPLAVKVVDWPLHIVTGGETETTGSGLTVTVTCADAVHPVTDPVTVYVVVVSGLAVTVEPLVLLNPVAGLHE